MTNAYGDFSQYYDMLGWGAFARACATRLRAFFKLRDKTPNKILDLACGSGELEKALGKVRISFTGVDLSPGMIRQAKKKYPAGRFIVGDAAATRLGEKFDMVVLLFDSANHMRSLPHLTSVFRNARRHLASDGFFIFDFLTDQGLWEWEQLDIRRTKDYTLFWYGYYYPVERSADIFIEAFIKQPDGDFRRVFQKIVEKTYPPRDIIQSLYKCGFTRIAASPFDLDEEIDAASRLWFVCQP
jgi:SAM-dependent methyltransferase